MCAQRSDPIRRHSIAFLLSTRSAGSVAGQFALQGLLAYRTGNAARRLVGVRCRLAGCSICMIACVLTAPDQRVGRWSPALGADRDECQRVHGPMARDFGRGLEGINGEILDIQLSHHILQVRGRTTLGIRLASHQYPDYGSDFRQASNLLFQCARSDSSTSRISVPIFPYGSLWVRIGRSSRLRCTNLLLQKKHGFARYS